jgi:integrase
MMPVMDDRPTGHLEPAGRDRWYLVANLPAVERDEKRTYPRLTRTIVAKRKKDAAQVLADWLDEIAAHASTDPNRLTVAEMCRRWLAAIDVRPKTRQFYADNVRLHIAPTLGRMRAAEVRPSHLEALYVAKRDAGLSETSQRHIHATIRAAYTWAMREDLQDRNPAERIKSPPRQTRREVTVWTQDDVVRAIAEADGLQMLVPLALGAWAGLRAGEMCGLRWDAVDLERGILKVIRALEQTRDGLHEVAPKSAAGVRWIPLPARATGILRAEKHAQDAHRLEVGAWWNQDGNVLVRGSGEPMKPNDLSSSWRRFCKRHGLPVVRLHDLRHSYATELFEQGGEGMLKVVQERLGHAHPSTTAGIYLHVTPAVDKITTEELNASIADSEERFARTSEKNSQTIRRTVVDLDAARRQKSRK